MMAPPYLCSPFFLKAYPARAPLVGESPRVRLGAPIVFPLEHKNCAVGKMEGVNPFRKISLLFTYMQCREEAGIVSNDGHFCAVTAHLVKHPFHELHEYIQILFESEDKGPIVVLWLWCRAMELPSYFSPFLL